MYLVHTNIENSLLFGQRKGTIMQIKHNKPVSVKKKRVSRSLSVRLKQAMDKVPIMSLCSYAMRTIKGTVSFRVNDICFASMSSRIPLSEIVFDLSRVKKIDKEKKFKYSQWKAYAKYIVEESPWARMFRNKNVGSVMRYGASLNTDASFSLCVSAAIALREGYEYHPKLPVFTMLLKQGVSKHAAYLTSCAVHTKLDGFIAVSMGQGHHAICGDTLTNDVIGVFTQGFCRKDKPAKECSATFKVFEQMGVRSPYGENRLSRFVDKNLVHVKRNNGWYAETFVTKDSVIKLAHKFDELLKKGMS